MEVDALYPSAVLRALSLSKGWFDCVVGCAAAASMQGIERVGARMKPAPEPERLRLSELQRSRH
jgi:hypothetical protein